MAPNPLNWNDWPAQKSTVTVDGTPLVVVPPDMVLVLVAVKEMAGVGYTVITYVSSGPTQPAAVGVMVTVAKIAVAPVLVAVNEGMSPVPLAPRPIAVLLFVHAKVVPETRLVTGVNGAVAPLQKPWSAIAVTVGVGLTV